MQMKLRVYEGRKIFINLKSKSCDHIKWGSESAYQYGVYKDISNINPKYDILSTHFIYGIYLQELKVEYI